MLGLVTRLWDSVGDSNIMTIEPRVEALRITLRIFDIELPEAKRGTVPSARDVVFDVGRRRSV